MKGGRVAFGCWRTFFDFTGVTDHDRRALECARANGMETSAILERTSQRDREYGSRVKFFKKQSLRPHPG